MKCKICNQNETDIASGICDECAGKVYDIITKRESNWVRPSKDMNNKPTNNQIIERLELLKLHIKNHYQNGYLGILATSDNLQALSRNACKEIDEIILTQK